MSLEMYSVLDDLLFETFFETQIASGFAAVRAENRPTCKVLRVGLLMLYDNALSLLFGILCLTIMCSFF